MTRAARSRWVVLAALAIVVTLAFVVLAPRPGADPERSPLSASPSPTDRVAVELTPLTTASPAPTSTPAPEVSAVWLIDTRLDRALRLTETTGYLIHAGFDEARPEVVVGAAHQGPPEVRTLYRFDLDGKLLERGEWTDTAMSPRPRCVEIRSVQAGPPAAGDPPSLIEIGGRRFEGVSCGPLSPNGRRMTYWVWVSPARADLPWSIDQWVIDLASGERRLLKEGLVHCGGCDSVPGPKWSPSGRYVYFSDVVGGGDRFFLSDVQSSQTRQLTDHVPREAFDVPVWSPVADILFHSNGSGSTVVEDLAGGKRTVLSELPWPARPDPTGAYLYAPAWPSETRPGTSLTVIRVASGAVVASLGGRPEPRTYIGTGGPPIDRHPVIGVPQGFVAALQDAPGCAGTAIYRDGALVTCVANAARPEFSPDGTKVALARATGDPVTRDMCSACVVREIVVIDVASGREIASAGKFVRVVMSYAFVTDPAGAVEYSWNSSGTHLLVAGAADR